MGCGGAFRALTNAAEGVSPTRASATHGIQHAVDADAAPLTLGAAEALHQAVRPTRRQTCQGRAAAQQPLPGWQRAQEGPSPAR